MVLDLFQNLTCQYHDRCRAIPHFCVLRSGNVGEYACGGVDDIKELRALLSDPGKVGGGGRLTHFHNRGAIIRDSLLAVGID